jgi:hypothetical protein
MRAARSARVCKHQAQNGALDRPMHSFAESALAVVKIKKKNAAGP